MAGPPPIPDTAGLLAALEAEGVDAADVTVGFVPKFTVTLTDEEP
jgi:hypothetical protein